MKPPEIVIQELVSGWNDKAEEDFRVAEHLLKDGGFYSAIGFHAQQAAEKFLKALLVFHQIEFPKTHNLGQLLDLIAKVDAELAKSIDDTDALTQYGVDYRYPGDLPELTEANAKEALALASKVRGVVLKAVAKKTNAAPKAPTGA